MYTKVIELFEALPENKKFLIAGEYSCNGSHCAVGKIIPELAQYSALNKVSIYNVILNNTLYTGADEASMVVLSAMTKLGLSCRELENLQDVNDNINYTEDRSAGYAQVYKVYDNTLATCKKRFNAVLQYMKDQDKAQ